jgi:thiol-disulfide isomerase/thioredoxin
VGLRRSRRACRGLAALAVGLWALGALPVEAASHFANSLGLQMAKEPVEAPAFTLRDLAGKKVALEEYRGKLVFLNFFATWCAPCRQEMPAMERLYRSYRDKGLLLLALNVRETAREVRPFVQELALSFPVLLDADGLVAYKYTVRGLPATYLIGRDGQMLWRALGPREWDGPDARAYFTQVLARIAHEKP